MKSLCSYMDTRVLCMLQYLFRCQCPLRFHCWNETDTNELGYFDIRQAENELEAVTRRKLDQNRFF